MRYIYFLLSATLAILTACQRSPGLELDFQASRLEVLINGQVLASGSTYDWGKVDTLAPVTLACSVKNPSFATVTFTGSNPITIGGTHSSDITIGQPTVTSLASGATTSFSLTITPKHVLNRSAFITIASNAESGTYTLNLKGYGYGAIMVKDIRPGSGSSSPIALTTYNGYLYFAATDGINGTELWRTDGTPEGTVLFKEFIVGAANGLSPITHSMVVFNNLLYLAGSDATNGGELWKSDGTAGGTALLVNIFPGSTDSNPTSLTVLGSELIFSAARNATEDEEIQKSNGNVGNVSFVKDINATASTSGAAKYLTAMGSNVFFQANDGTNGVELWKSDGTTGGTSMVTNIYTGADRIFPTFLGCSGRVCVFCADSSTEGYELRRSDGTTTSTIVDLYAGVNTGCASTAGTVGKLNNSIVFRGNSNNGMNAELYLSDGSIGNAVLIKDINPGSLSSTPSGFTQFGNHSYFSATDGTRGLELWRTDGTAAGTVLVADIASGATGSSPANFTVFGSALLFTATDPDLGTELYIYVPKPE